MESSDAETVDCAVGTIVWVRRRNGSWWPGKILGPDELSASHLMSPRSGTPVKLLGREDASVDWYNLEKSKRVKPFRCGEFDDCIERAEASQGMPPKKREKYARREDAILHALELEKQVLEKKYGKSPTNGLSTKALTVVVDDKRKRDDDSFRDLIKHKPNGENVAGKKVLEKRKRSQEGNNNNNNNMEETVGKRRDRHRPLVQVLESTHPLQSKADEQQRQVVAIANDPGMTAGETFSDQAEVKLEVEPPIASSEDNNTSGSNEDTETDSSGTESLISDTYDAMAALSGEDMEFIPKAKGKGKAFGEDSDDDNDSVVSKWQLKGKRNNRSSVRKRSSNSSHWMMGFKGEDIGFGLGGYNNYNVGGGVGLDMSWDDEDVNGGMLIDVEVGVQSGYQREHVPMISLMSKLNDKAIVGHPIPIQALEDGSSDLILSDHPTTRRTSRPPHLSTLEDPQQQQQEYYYYYDNDEDGKRSAPVSFKARKKPQRRSTSSFTSQKIRTLSSIGGTHHQSMSMDMKEAGEVGVMKPESLPKGTAVACIPVKLVFSRLHEELLVARHQ